MSVNNIEQVARHNDRVKYQVTLYGDETIHTTVTSYPSAVKNWIKRIESMHRYRLHNLIVGLDVEWRPNNRYHTNRVSVVQLCVGHHCLVFQIQHACEIPQALFNFLADRNYTFVGVGVGDDAEKLYQDYRLSICNTVDLRVLASTRWNQPQCRNQGLVALAKRALDLTYNKPKYITLSNWSVPDLNEAQIRYAAIDAFLSFEIGRVLNAAHFHD